MFAPDHTNKILKARAVKLGKKSIVYNSKRTQLLGKHIKRTMVQGLYLIFICISNLAALFLHDIYTVLNTNLFQFQFIN